MSSPDYRDYVPTGHSWIFLPGETYLQPKSGKVVMVDADPMVGYHRHVQYWDWYVLVWTDKPRSYVLGYMTHYTQLTSIYRVTETVVEKGLEPKTIQCPK